MVEVKLIVNEDWILEGNFECDIVVLVVDKIIVMDKCFMVVFCFNDMMVLGLMSCL